MFRLHLKRASSLGAIALFAICVLTPKPADALPATPSTIFGYVDWPMVDGERSCHGEAIVGAVAAPVEGDRFVRIMLNGVLEGDYYTASPSTLVTLLEGLNTITFQLIHPGVGTVARHELSVVFPDDCLGPPCRR